VKMATRSACWPVRLRKNWSLASVTGTYFSDSAASSSGRMSPPSGSRAMSSRPLRSR
jgi:hypothetical protein